MFNLIMILYVLLCRYVQVPGWLLREPEAGGGEEDSAHRARFPIQYPTHLAQTRVRSLGAYS